MARLTLREIDTAHAEDYSQSEKDYDADMSFDNCFHPAEDDCFIEESYIQERDAWIFEDWHCDDL